MKKTKILAPALGILTLSMAASVTGTVAWFSSNATVSAAGMNISAVTATNLFINNSTITDGVFGAITPGGTMITLGDAGKSVADISDTHGADAHKLVPVSPISNFETYIYVADSTKVAMGGQIFSDSNPETGTFSTASLAGSNWGGLKDYVNVGAVDLYLQDESKRDIQVTVRVTPTDDQKQALLPATRVALRFVNDEGGAEETMTTTVFSSTGTDAVRPLASVTTIGEAQATEAYETPYTISAAGGMVNNHTVRVLIFFYFEGQDGAAINQNSLNSAGYDVNFSWTASV